MNAEKFTQKSIEALNAATALANENGNQQITSLHLLHALLTDEEGVCARVIEKMGISSKKVVGELESSINKLVKVEGKGGEYIAQDLSEVLTLAEKKAKEMQDDFISVEHLLYGIIEKPSKEVSVILKNNGITKENFLSALMQIRGNVRVVKRATLCGRDN
ncbi:MAG: hypothetical protein E7364_02975 [Clostridiales bacterium]|nr:hypothetical protein [Clostridiales bacterium]MBE7100557.1 hypothetical protein [Clostridiales bacterium]